MPIISANTNLSDFKTQHDAPAFRNIEALPEVPQELFDKMLDIDSELDGKRTQAEADAENLREQIADVDRLAGHHDREIRSGLHDDHTTAKRRQDYDVKRKRLKTRRGKVLASLATMARGNYGDQTLTFFGKPRGAYAYRPFPTDDDTDPREAYEAAIKAAVEALNSKGELATGFLPPDVIRDRALRDLNKLARINKDKPSTEILNIKPCAVLREDGTDKPTQGELGILRTTTTDAMGNIVTVPDVAAMFFRANYDKCAADIERQIAELEKSKIYKPVSRAEREARIAEIDSEVAASIFEASAWCWKARELGIAVLPPLLADVPRKVLVESWLQIKPADKAAPVDDESPFEDDDFG